MRLLSALADLASPLRRPKPPIMLNLGCGKQTHSDWVNVDFVAGVPGIVSHDLRAPLPFADESCSVVYHSHVLEHFPRAFAPAFLAECRRVLSRGGLIRVVVPDLETIARLYLQCLEGAVAGDPVASERYEWITLEMMDQMVREKSGGEMQEFWRRDPLPAADFIRQRMGQEFERFAKRPRQQDSTPPARAAPDRSPEPAEVAKFRETGEIHRWMYDRYSLARLLEQSGFADIRVCAATESAIPDFARYHLDVEPDHSVRKPDSLFMEARKP